MCVCVWVSVYKALMLRLNEFLIALFTIEFFRYKLFILPKILNPPSLEKARAVFFSYLETRFYIVFALVWVWVWMLLSLREFNIFLLRCCYLRVLVNLCCFSVPLLDFSFAHKYKCGYCQPLC